MRKIVDLKDLKAGELVYPATHSDAVLLPDGRSVTEAISEGGGGGSAAYPQVNHGMNDTTFELTPNTLHVWGEVRELDLSLAPEKAGVTNEYIVQFESGAIATTLALPSGLMWAGDSVPIVNPLKKYQLSIVNGLAVIAEFSYSLITNNITIETDWDFSKVWLRSEYPLGTTLYFWAGSGYSQELAAGESEWLLNYALPGTYDTAITLTPDVPDEQVLEVSDGVYKYVIPASVTIPI